MRKSKFSSPLLNTKFKNPSSKPQQKPQLNRFPLTQISHRALPPFYVSKVNFLSINQKQQKLRKLFSSASNDQRILTAKIISFRENDIDAIIENNDSFNDRYSPRKHKFSHNLIGEIQLPRKFFTNSLNERVFSTPNPELLPKQLKFSSLFYQPAKVPSKTQKIHSREIRRKARTSFVHYKQLRIDPSAVPKLKKYLPGVPYGYPRSEEFIRYCKEGNQEKVTAYLEKNKWLAHVFDKSGQTALHWAVKRHQIQVANILINSGVWVDVTDNVGRSPLFIAVKNEDLNMISFLVSRNANSFVCTRAGTMIFDGVSSPIIKNLLIKKGKRHQEAVINSLL